jgi:hypothetical protein
MARFTEANLQLVHADCEFFAEGCEEEQDIRETDPTTIKVDLGDDSDNIKWDELYDTDVVW